MYRVLPPARWLPLYGVQATREIERDAAAGLPPHTLMRRAGSAVARLALAIAPHAQRVWVCAGPGNNGGDGLDAAIHLAAVGKQVWVTLVGDPQKLPDDARDAYGRALASGVQVQVGAPPLVPDMAIDGLLGVGASRPPEGALAAAIEQLNALRCPVLAIDLPSGLHADTGQPLGGPVVQATHTIALLSLKPGLFTAAGRDHAGDIWFDDLGVASESHAPQARLTGSEAVARLPRRHAQHKGSFGDVAVVGGAPGMRGAAILAARAAHACGAGRVYVDPLEGDAASLDPAQPELMFRHAWWRGPDAVLAQTTVVCGCGGGDAVRQALPRLLSASARLVLDADALNAIASDTSLLILLQARASRGRPTVLTPHPLEAARLLSVSTAQVQADRLAAARSLAQRVHATVVLKGSGTVIASPDDTPCINPTGSAALATAGTGDVLAGAIGGLWAQSSDAAAQAIATAAVFRHGMAADASARHLMPAGALIDAMRE